MSDSESEESADQIARMSDAADPRFTNLFNKKPPSDKSHQADLQDRGTNFQHASAPSFRNQMNNDTYDNLGTTPEFRHHVAKKLSDILDRKIKLVKDCKEAIHPPTSKLTTNDGVHLFATSISCIDVQNKEDAGFERKSSTKRKRKKSAGSSSSSDELEKLASVAVSGEWVLSKKGLYGENDKVTCAVGCEVSTKALTSSEIVTPTVQHSNVGRKKKKRKRQQHSDVNYELASMAVSSKCALSNDGLHDENDKEITREGIIDKRPDADFDASTKTLISAENGTSNVRHRNVCGKKKKKKRGKGCNSQQEMKNKCMAVNL